MEDKYSEYNKEQYEALIYDEGPLLIMAGAGSGKTRVLTGKIARLIEEKNVPRWSILAFTFTNKAAGEMKERVSKLLDMDVSDMWIGTFHSLSSRILRFNIEKIGYTSDFVIYDSQDQKTLLKDALKSLDMDPSNFHLGSILSTISNKKNEGISPSQMYDDAIYSQDKELAEIYKTYEDMKKSNNALDFDDLIIKAIEVLKENEDILEKYQDKFKYVFVDEYQDTNHSQYVLIKLLTGKHKNICVVGDSDQSIYGWRGADISNILDFEKDFPNAKVITLEQNYRSKGKILNAANSLIKNNKKRKEKNLWTDQGDGDDVVYKMTQSDFDEAESVITWINQMKYRGYKYSEMAILYRTNAQSRLFEERLMREGITYKVIGGIKFYDRKEIKDLIAYLNIIINDRDDLSLIRVINTPKRGIGDTTVERLINYALSNEISIYDALDDDIEGINKGTQTKLRNFKEMIKSFKEKEKILDLDELIMEVYEDSGMMESFESSNKVEDKSRIENVSSFVNAVSEYQEMTDEPSLRDYLQNIALMSELDKTEDTTDALSLMTMHSAKGLEFDCVFVVGLEDGLFPSKRTIEEGRIEEERRLFYVAMTRAKERLFLSSAQTRRVYGNNVITRESRFIDEIRDDIKVEEPKVKEIENPLISYEKNEERKKRDIYREKLLDRKKVYEENKRKKYRSGDKIKHKKFGIGTIVMVNENPDGDELTISFENKGLKRLNANYAPLEVLDGR